MRWLFCLAVIFTAFLAAPSYGQHFEAPRVERPVVRPTMPVTSSRPLTAPELQRAPPAELPLNTTSLATTRMTSNPPMQCHGHWTIARRACTHIEAAAQRVALNQVQ